MEPKYVTLANCANYIRAMIVCCALSNSVAAQCSNTTNAGDADLWASSPVLTHQGYRNAIASYFNMQKDDWDEGWGWAKYNDANPSQYSFTKMMGSCHLLWYGIDDVVGAEVEHQHSAWQKSDVPCGANVASQEYPRLSGVSRNASTIDVVYKSEAGKLMHARLGGGNWWPGTPVPQVFTSNVSDLLAQEKNSYHISGDPIVVSRDAESLDVLARQGNALLHFEWSSAAGWAVQNPTEITSRPQPVNGSPRYFIEGAIHVLARGSSRIDIAAHDADNHTILYMLDHGGWGAEDINVRLPTAERINSDMALSRGPAGTIVVTGASVVGKLVLYERSDAGGISGGIVDRALANLPTNERIVGATAVCSPDDVATMAFYRTSADRLYMLIKSGWLDWTRAPVATAYVITSAPTVVKRKPNTIDGVARELNGNLVHFWFTAPGGLGSTVLDGTWTTDGNPVHLVAASQKRLDVAACDYAGHLRHLWWSEGLGWETENVHSGNTMISVTTDRINHQLVFVKRGASGLDLLAGSALSSTQTKHFGTAIGAAVVSWHTNDEYSAWAAGGEHDFKYTPGEDNDAFANARRAWILHDRVQMNCPSFNPDGAWTPSPATRASTMVHEATHMNYWRFKHKSNPPGSNCSEECSDDWFFHGSRHPSGELTTGHRTHSMNQIQIEYLTDISQLARWWVPIGAYQNALALAQGRMTNRIRNPPGWTPGEPRPFQ